MTKSQIHPLPGETYGTTHDWRQHETFQWGAAGAPARTAYTRWACEACGERFVHMYNVVPNIFEAMRQEGVSDVCRAFVPRKDKKK